MNAQNRPWDRDQYSLPLAVILISLNEGHAMEAVLENLKGWAGEVFLVDSFSTDRTVDIALRHGVHVVQRKFTGFGDQWNFALDELPISMPWTMKLDPDERLTPELKRNIAQAMADGAGDGISFARRLWFMGQPLGVAQDLTRVWKTGCCRFSDVLVNEHPIVKGNVVRVAGELEHHDSPNLHHWFEKQNRYSTAEATGTFRNAALSDEPRLLGTPLQRRMWLKAHYRKVPFRYLLVFLYSLFGLGAWRAGKVGVMWARLRSDVYRMRDYKLAEMKMQNTSRAAGTTKNRTEQVA
ncbi:MAG: glycosyltransferase family 2 protein [Rhizobiales bacterium]|nr:glycosyltransferase family 2 protein [Hyphomicrobiales bacterium]